MVTCALLIPLLPLAWMAVTAPWQVIFINGFGGLIWAGYNLALANMVMILSPAEKRARYAAAFQTVMFADAFAGPMLGGYIIGAAGFRAVFARSAAGRFVATLVLLRYVVVQFESRRPHAQPSPSPA